MSGHEGSVSGVALHPTNARQVLSSSMDGTLRAWDVDDGHCLRVLRVGYPLVRLVSAPFPANCAPCVYAVAAVFGDSQEDTRAEAAAVAAAAAAASRASGKDGKSKKRARTEEKEPEAVAGAEQAVTKGAASAGKGAPSAPRAAALNPWHVPGADESAAQVARAGDYPLGDETACLQVRPPSYAAASTVDDKGYRRPAPTSRLLQIDLRMGGTEGRQIVRPLMQRVGYTTGLAARCYGQGPEGGAALESTATPDVALALTIGASLFVLRSSAAGASLNVHRSPGLLSAAALHPSEPYVTTGELKGKLLTWFLPELETGYVPPPTGASLVGTSSTSGLDVDGLLSAMPDSPEATPRMSVAHWHSHCPWDATIVSDGSYLLSGGEEATLVLWQLPSGAAGGAAGPVSHKRTMTFVPRLGAPVRNLASFSAGATPGGVSTASRAAAADALSASHVRDTPKLMFAAVLVDNSVVLVNGATLTALWRVAGLALAGTPAAMPAGLAAYYSRAAEKAGAKALEAAALAGDSALVMRLRGPPSALFPTPPLPSALLAVGRHLSAGLVMDPRTRAIVVNGFPGRGSLQLYDHRRRTVVGSIEVSPSNVPSRTDDEPAPPARVTHVAFSTDGSICVTVEVVPGPVAGEGGAAGVRGVGGENSVLKFWHVRSPNTAAGAASWALDTRVESPHKTDINVLLFAPGGEPLAVTASADRTFKTWARTVHAEAIGTVEGRTIATLAEAARKAAGSGAAPAPTAARVTYSWSCVSVGFYRDAPVTAGSISADGSLLALGFGPTLTLWSPRSNALRKTLLLPAAPPATAGAPATVAVVDEDDALDIAGAAFSGASGSAIALNGGGGTGWRGGVRSRPETLTHLAFLGLSPYLAAATASHLVVFDLTTCEPVWSFAARVTALAPDRLGLAATDRFAVVVAVWDAASVAGAAASQHTHTALVFKASSPVPLAVWPLHQAPCSSGLLLEKVGSGAAAPPVFAVAFGPPAVGAAAPAGTVVGNSLLVFGPSHGLVSHATPPLLAASVAEAAPAEIVTVSSFIGATAAAETIVTAPAVRGVVHPIDGSALVDGAALRALTSGRPAGSPEKGPHAPAARPTAASGSALDALLASITSVSALPSASAVASAILAALLPAAVVPRAAVERPAGGARSGARGWDKVPDDAMVGGPEADGGAAVVEEAAAWGLTV